jgi:hypothetical protein
VSTGAAVVGPLVAVNLLTPEASVSIPLGVVLFFGSGALSLLAEYLAGRKRGEVRGAVYAYLSEEVGLRGVMRLGDTVNALLELVALAIAVWFSSAWAALLIIPVVGGVIKLQVHDLRRLHVARSRCSLQLGEVSQRVTELLEGREEFFRHGRGGILASRLPRQLSPC